MGYKSTIYINNRLRRSQWVASFTGYLNNILLIIVTATFFIQAGCATSTYSFGNDFSSEDVKKIVRGKTTTTDLVNLFGQPYTKSVVSKTSEKWLYTYTTSTATAQSYIVTTTVESTGLQKTLDILIENGIVTNYTFSERPIPKSSVY